MESTYTDKEIVKAYLEKLQRKRKFTGKEAGIILFLININLKYSDEEEKYINDIDLEKLIERAQKSITSDKNKYEYDVYKALHASLEIYREKFNELETLWLSYCKSIQKKVMLTAEIENACNTKELKRNGNLYNTFSFDSLLNKECIDNSQCEKLVEGLRHLLAYDELLKILEKEYNIYNLCDCYGLNNEKVYKKNVSQINKWICNLKEVLPLREKEIDKVFPLIRYEIYKPSKKNIKEIEKIIKKIGLNYGAVNEYKYRISDYMGYLTIDCIDEWEKNNGASSIEIRNRINKLVVKQLNE